MKRRKIAAGNWKMNTTLEEGLQLARDLANSIRPADVITILGVPYTHLKSIFDQTLHVPNLEIAAQNCHHELSGAYTGEISIDMLSSLGLGYVIIGHSERRQYFNEDDKQVGRKLKLALDAGLTPIYCCGEPLEVRKLNKQNAYVIEQIKSSFNHLDKDSVSKVIIAYEPIWAIGTGETATPEQAQDMHSVIRGLLEDLYGNETSESMSILYGGSVKDTNAKELFANPDVDGGLVGGASLKFDSFLKIIHSF